MFRVVRAQALQQLARRLAAQAAELVAHVGLVGVAAGDRQLGQRHGRGLQRAQQRLLEALHALELLGREPQLGEEQSLGVALAPAQPRRGRPEWQRGVPVQGERARPRVGAAGRELPAQHVQQDRDALPVAARLRDHYPVLYTGRNGRVAHECILDVRPLKESAGVTAEDIAKRLMDYGFHAPTMSFPVAGTLMVEPTESEGLAELDRFIEAMIAIRAEIADIEAGRSDRQDNPLKNAPHTAEMLLAEEWHHAYPRQQAAYPVPGLRQAKYWPPVARVDNAYGDRNLVCACPPVEAYAQADA